MASFKEKTRLFSTLLDPSPQPRQMNTTKRRYRRSKTIPANLHLLRTKDNMTLPSQSVLGKLHPSLKQVVLLLAFYLTAGAICFSFTNKQIKGKKTNGILDSVYFCIVTMTTVGYGDLVPNSVATKLLACAFVFLGMALVALTLSKAADYLVEKQEMLFVKTLHIHQNFGATDILKKIESNKVKYKLFMVLIFLILLIIAGTIFLSEIENLSLVDSFYCVCATITTLGYGDKSFSTKAGRIFAVFWILTSTISLALCFLYLAELNTQHRQQELAKWVLTRRMTNVDLEVADLDEDGVVSAAEFIVYKLKEMGKISQEDIVAVMEEFEDLDVNQNGTLSPSDITLAQS
ncbi:hypothetical protein GIB67_013412 [Kingdonia uniflora]|uniref:Uncharacterized protein n=1 Tax=Kingdonia uniflora TaxID=39325 RepID=A0A7J7LQY0_9MAGN|nr:hypothetical protein GIB67_013412 [Kingdonia uniflora]